MADLAGTKFGLMVAASTGQEDMPVEQTKIEELIRIAAANPSDFAQSMDIEQIDRQTLAIGTQVRISYFQHKLRFSDQVLAHLSIHGDRGLVLEDTFIDEMADKFGLGPRSTWRAIWTNRPPAPSAHVFKLLGNK